EHARDEQPAGEPVLPQPHCPGPLGPTTGTRRSDRLPGFGCFQFHDRGNSGRGWRLDGRVIGRNDIRLVSSYQLCVTGSSISLERKVIVRIGLSVYGTVFSMGIHPQPGRPTIKPGQLMDRAIAAGLEGVELPTSLLQNEDVTAVARYAQEHGLYITLAASGYDPDTLV